MRLNVHANVNKAVQTIQRRKKALEFTQTIKKAGASTQGWRFTRLPLGLLDTAPQSIKSIAHPWTWQKLINLCSQQQHWYLEDGEQIGSIAKCCLLPQLGLKSDIRRWFWSWQPSFKWQRFTRKATNEWCLPISLDLLLSNQAWNF